MADAGIITMSFWPPAQCVQTGRVPVLRKNLTLTYFEYEMDLPFPPPCGDI